MKQLTEQQRELVYQMSTDDSIEKMDISEWTKQWLWKQHDRALDFSNDFTDDDLECLNSIRKIYINRVLKNVSR